MKRWPFNLAAALSLLLSLAAAAAWAISHARPPAWRLIGTAHSADLTRVNSESRTAHFTTTADLVESPEPRVLGRVVGAEPIRAADPTRAGRRLRRHVAPGIRVATVADRRPAGRGARAGRGVRSHA
jgi:hypothetical protein